MNTELAEWEAKFLFVALRCVTQFSSSFASEFWSVRPSVATRRLRKLEKRGLLKGRTVLASELPSMSVPLCTWRPGENYPHYGRISYLARRRWHSLPLLVKRVYYATTLSRSLFGRSAVKPPKDIQATHDVGLASVYLSYRRRCDKLTERCWLNESEYAHHRGRCVKVEDAMLCRDGQVLLLIDFAGAYRPDRVESLVRHAELYNVPIAIH